jgi:nitric oxide reductase subunit B
LVSKGWIQAVALVVLCGFAVLGLLAYRTYTAEPPIAARTVGPDGTVLFTRADVTEGQQVFLRAGLMEYGSIFGHGAYLGPDFTADYLHRAAELALRTYGGSDQARQRVISDFQANRYDSRTDTLTFSGAQAGAYRELERYYASYFGDPTTGKGMRPKAITNPADIHRLTSYFAWSAWSAWSASTHRPGKDYSYTNSWPPEPLVGNRPSGQVVVWSVLSLIALLIGIGALFAVLGRWGDRLGWRGRQAETISFRPPGRWR